MPAGHVVVVDAPYHRGFRLVDLQPGRGVSASWHPAVAVGRFPGHHLAGSGPEQSAPPIAFGDLAALVLGNDALHLGEQPGLRVVGEGGCVAEQHPNPELGELVEDETLVGVGAGQPVRGQAPHGLEGAGFGLIAQQVQAGPGQPGAGLAVVAELGDELIASLAYPGA
jgi:hypothetical protein